MGRSSGAQTCGLAPPAFRETAEELSGGVVVSASVRPVLLHDCQVGFGDQRHTSVPWEATLQARPIDQIERQSGRLRLALRRQ